MSLRQSPRDLSSSLLDALLRTGPTSTCDLVLRYFRKPDFAYVAVILILLRPAVVVYLVGEAMAWLTDESLGLWLCAAFDILIKLIA
jgi:hypothetical protein